MTPAERVRVHATAWAILKDPHAADDVAQELALRLERASDDVEPDVRGSWIARQAVGLSMNRRRGERRRARNERAAGLSRASRRGEPPERFLERAEDLEQVRTALAGLEDRQRLPLILRYFHDRRLAEIAHILEVPVSTAHERLQRGLSSLRGLLRRVDVTPALIGLALPRATAVVAPTVVLGRISALVGGAYWLARAAVLLAAVSLTPKAPGPDQDLASVELSVAAADPATQPPRFPQPPVRPPVVLEESELEPPVPPVPPVLPPLQGGDQVREERSGPNTESTNSEPWAGESAPGGHLVVAGPGTRAEALQVFGGDDTVVRDLSGEEPLPSNEDSAEGRDQGGDRDPDTGNSSSRGNGGDDPDSGKSDGGSLGDGGSGGDDDDDGQDRPGLGESNGGGFRGGPLPGKVFARDGAFTGGLWVLVIPVIGENDGPGTTKPIAAAATDERGRFRLDLPGRMGEFIVQVAVPDDEGGLDLLPLREGSLRPDGALRLEVE